MIRFSNSTRCFYDDDMFKNNLEAIPDDALEVSEQDVINYSGQNPQWMLPNVSTSGQMEWIDDPSIDKKAARYEINKQVQDSYLNVAAREHYTLEVIGKSMPLSPEQSEMMTSLSLYMTELMQVDLYSDNPSWPTHP